VRHAAAPGFKQFIAELLAARASFTTKTAPMFSTNQGDGKRREAALTGIYGFYIMGTAQKIGNSPCQSA